MKEVAAVFREEGWRRRQLPVFGRDKRKKDERHGRKEEMRKSRRAKRERKMTEIGRKERKRREKERGDEARIGGSLLGEEI